MNSVTLLTLTPKQIAIAVEYYLNAVVLKDEVLVESVVYNAIPGTFDIFLKQEEEIDD